ncbi:hypothetical protein ONZ45_g13779 [Pleurotus djamor]|nr:hypothetical protein ONZ45_g13779 [Pleurotus djamor]
MISTTLSIFCGLQDHLKDILRNLPSSTSPQLKAALTVSRRKLSDYYFKYDESPYYTWGKAFEKTIAMTPPSLNISRTPRRICKIIFNQDISSVARHPPLPPPLPLYPVPTLPPPVLSTPPQKINFTKRYQQKDRPDADQLLDFFKVPQESFDHCDPIKWWVGRKSQFPDLFRLARDILSIPGSAVAVERVFSGGRDTISLRRASLKPETIRTLVLVKQHLRLGRTAVCEVLGSL